MRSRLDPPFPLTGVLALLLLAPAVLAAQATPAPTAKLERALQSRAKGGDSTDVVVFEIADFQCPHCARFAREIGPILDERYVDTGQVQWVFVNLPLHTHPLAWHAAEAALCAGVAGDRFWEMHDRLFAEQDTWATAPDPLALFDSYATDLGVPEAEYQDCTQRDEVAALIIQDLGSAISAGVTGTPTFVILKGQQVVNQIVGVGSMEEWTAALAEALQ